MDYVKQDGLIVDDVPMGFKDAKSAAEIMAKDPHYARFHVPLVEAMGIIQYTNESQPLTLWWVFGPESMAYPTVVRRRTINRGVYIENRTSIMCEASASACEAIRQRFDATDHLCGKAVAACRH
jgi:hypothetical protein